jgi:hypothetical protein
LAHVLGERVEHFGISERESIAEVAALRVYRSLVTFCLLVAGFCTLPGHRAAFALGVIAFTTGIAAVIENQNKLALLQNAADDMGERKTRHAIVLAQELALEGRPARAPMFWVDVDKRVDAEAQRPQFIQERAAAKSTLRRVLGLVGSDLISLVAALIVSALFGTI